MTDTLSLEKNVHHGTRSLLWRSIALGWSTGLLAVFLSGCFPTLGPTRHFRYSIDYSFDGHNYLKQQDLSCSPIKNFSEANGSWVPRWHITGEGISAVDLGHNLVLLYNVNTFCGQYDAYDDLRLEEYEGNVTVVENPMAPTIVSKGRFVDTNPPLTVNREWIVRTDAPKKQIQPSADQLALVKTIYANQYGFRGVYYSIIPYERWATSEESRKYFAKFNAVTASNIDQFPFAKDRIYSDSWPPKATPTPEFKYDGEKFVAYNWKDDGTRHCYPVKGATQAQGSVLVSYKGAEFTLSGNREVYVPETKSIVAFTVYPCQLTPGGGLPIPPPK